MDEVLRVPCNQRDKALHGSAWKNRSQSEVVLTLWVSATLAGLKTSQHSIANHITMKINALKTQ